MPRALGLWLVGFLAAINVAACGPSWPHVHGLGDRDFMTRQRSVSTVDLLPVDMQVWGENGSSVDPTQLADALAALINFSVESELLRRGYGLGVTVDWNGSTQLPSGASEPLLSEEAVVQTAYSLSGYGIAQERSPGTVLEPHLPARLGPTGSQATLYVGGWAYAGKKRTSKGAKVAKGLLIGVFIIGAVIVIAAMAKGGGGKSGGKSHSGTTHGGSSHGGSALGAMGRAVGSGAKVVARASTGIVRSTGAVGQLAGDVISATARGAMRAGVVVARSGSRIAVDTADAFGRSHTHLEFYQGRPDYYQQPELPKQGYSEMLLEMTLVENQRGHVLWHARQRFPADPRNEKQVRRAVADMLKSLPAGG